MEKKYLKCKVNLSALSCVIDCVVSIIRWRSHTIAPSHITVLYYLINWNNLVDIVIWMNNKSYDKVENYVPDEAESEEEIVNIFYFKKISNTEKKEEINRGRTENIKCCADRKI